MPTTGKDLARAFGPAEPARVRVEGLAGLTAGRWVRERFAAALAFMGAWTEIVELALAE